MGPPCDLGRGWTCWHFLGHLPGGGWAHHVLRFKAAPHRYMVSRVPGSQPRPRQVSPQSPPGRVPSSFGKLSGGVGRRATKTCASQAACNCRNLFQRTFSSCRESVNVKHDTGQPRGYGDSVWLSGAEPWCVVCTSAFRAGRSPSRPAPQGRAHMLVQSREPVFTVAWGVGCWNRQPFPQPQHLGAWPWAWVLALISPPLQCLPWGLTPSREPRRHD